MGELSLEVSLLGFKRLQFKLCHRDLPQQLGFLGGEIFSKGLLQRSMFGLEFLDLVYQFDDLLVQLMRAKRQVEDVLMGATRDHSCLELRSIFSDNTLNTFLLKFGGLREILCDDLVSSEVSDSLLKR